MLPSYQYSFKICCGLSRSFLRGGVSSTTQSMMPDSLVWSGKEGGSFIVVHYWKGQIYPALPLGKSNADTSFSVNRNPQNHCINLHTSPGMATCNSCLAPQNLCIAKNHLIRDIQTGKSDLALCHLFSHLVTQHKQLWAPASAVGFVFTGG